MSAAIGQSPGQAISNAMHISNPWIPQIRDISHALRGENEFWGKFKAPGIRSTLYIETEDGEPLLESRIRGLLRGFGIQEREQLPNFHYLRLGPFDLVKSESQLMEVINTLKPDFVVLSTLQGLLAGRDWNKQDAMADVNALLVKIGAMLPGGLVVITHSPQNPEVTRPAGTVAQLANYTTAIHFTKAGSSGSTYVDVKVDSKIGSEETHFRLDVILGDSPDGNGKEVRQIKYLPKKGPTKKQLVQKAFQQHGLECPTKKIMEIVNAQLFLSDDSVTSRYVTDIRNELQKKESEQQGYSSTPLVPSVSREQRAEQI